MWSPSGVYVDYVESYVELYVEFYVESMWTLYGMWGSVKYSQEVSIQYSFRQGKFNHSSLASSVS